MLTAEQMNKLYVGKNIAWATADGAEYFHRCLAVSAPYGRVLLLLQPIAGKGSTWRQAVKCRVMEDAPCES